MKKLSLIVILLGVVLSGCKARPAPDAGFLPYPDRFKEMRERTPFNATWIPNGTKLEDLKNTNKIMVVQPVVTEFVEVAVKKSDRSKESKEDRIADAKELAKYFESKMKQAFKDKGLQVSDTPVPNAMVWEVAITELRPSNPALTVAATAAGAFVPGGGLIRLADTGSVAIEVIVRDSNTGDILVGFKDREGEKNSAFSVRDFQLYAHLREAMDDWSEQFAELVTTPETHTVEDSSTVTLNPF